MYTRFLRIVPLMFLATMFACRQPQGPALDRLLVGEVLLHSEFTGNLRQLCLPGGRLSGSENSLRAARYVENQARAYGLKTRLEPFPMPGWQVRETVVRSPDDPALTFPNAIALGNTLSTPSEGVTAEVADVGAGTPDDFARLGATLAGKFALVCDEQGRRSDKMKLACDAGAAGLIVACRPGRPPTVSGSHVEPRPEPGVAIAHEDGQRLTELLAAGQTVRLTVTIRADVWEATAYNVIAELPGRGPRANELVLLGAHLDSWHLAEGAIDNANGSAVVLETARALAALPRQPRRTIRFIWFMGEEQGLFGSQAYVTAHRSELPRMVAMVNVDMPGAPRKFAAAGPPPLIASLAAVIQRLRGYELDPEIGPLSGRFSDHAPFQENGVPVLTLWGDLGDASRHHHTATDMFEVVDRPATLHSAAVLAVVLRHLADEYDPRSRPAGLP